MNRDALGDAVADAWVATASFSPSTHWIRVSVYNSCAQHLLGRTSDRAQPCLDFVAGHELAEEVVGDLRIELWPIRAASTLTLWPAAIAVLAKVWRAVEQAGGRRRLRKGAGSG